MPSEASGKLLKIKFDICSWLFSKVKKSKIWLKIPCNFCGIRKREKHACAKSRRLFEISDRNAKPNRHQRTIQTRPERKREKQKEENIKHKTIWADVSTRKDGK